MRTVDRRLAVLLASPLALLLLASSAANAESLTGWTSTTGYPTALAGTGCAAVGSDVYCVGGFDTNFNSYDDEYYAPLTSLGVGTWSAGPPYPTAVDSASCVSSGSWVYCVGGEEDQGQTVLNSVYGMQVPQSGPPTSWASGPTYPQATAAASCVAFGGYIYCVGGFNSNGDEVSNAYYAAVGSQGLGSWSSTTAYPKAVDSEACVVAEGGYIYCVAGEVESGGNPNTPINSVYYAQLGASGIGKWTAGTAYPASLAAASCVTLSDTSGTIYCTGGFDINGLSSSDSYYGTVSAPGAISWTSTAPYPEPVDTGSCVASSSDIYCLGGVNGLSSGEETVSSAYFTGVAGSTSTSSTTPEFPVSVAIPMMLAAALGVAAVGLRRLRL